MGQGQSGQIIFNRWVIGSWNSSCLRVYWIQKYMDCLIKKKTLPTKDWPDMMGKLILTFLKDWYWLSTRWIMCVLFRIQVHGKLRRDFLFPILSCKKEVGCWCMHCYLTLGNSERRLSQWMSDDRPQTIVLCSLLHSCFFFFFFPQHLWKLELQIHQLSNTTLDR